MFNILKICKHCKWWEAHGSPDNREGFCRLRGHVDGHYTDYWKVQPRDSYDTKEHPFPSWQISPACWAKHDEVRTSPDFGCNQWEGA